MKSEVVPVVVQAKELCTCNTTMFNAAVLSATQKGFVSGVALNHYIYGDTEVIFKGAMITRDGVEYLLENSTMHKAADVAGSAFKVALDVAIQALIQASHIL